MTSRSASTATIRRCRTDAARTGAGKSWRFQAGSLAPMLSLAMTRGSSVRSSRCGDSPVKLGRLRRVGSGPARPAAVRAGAGTGRNWRPRRALTASGPGGRGSSRCEPSRPIRTVLAPASSQPASAAVSTRRRPGSAAPACSEVRIQVSSSGSWDAAPARSSGVGSSVPRDHSHSGRSSTSGPAEATSAPGILSSSSEPWARARRFSTTSAASCTSRAAPAVDGPVSATTTTRPRGRPPRRAGERWSSSRCTARRQNSSGSSSASSHCDVSSRCGGPTRLRPS